MQLKLTGKWQYVLIGVGLVMASCKKDAIVKKEKDIRKSMEVSTETALQVARDFSYQAAFLNDPSVTAKQPHTMGATTFASGKKLKKAFAINDTHGQAALYVINLDPAGFIVVSGSKKEVPILAFSEKGTFAYDPVNPPSFGITDWVQERVKKIGKIRDTPAYEPDVHIKEQWDGYAPPIGEEEIVSGGTVYEQKGPYTSTIWGQGPGYNDQVPYMLCSTTGNGHAWAGCVAVATAQVMKYWHYPNSYSWSAMPDNAGSNETSRLIHDIGVDVNMDYGCEGSSAQTKKVENVLEGDFGYSTSIQYVSTTSTAIVQQMNAQWPVVIRGSLLNGTGGHAWVCDGYRRNRHVLIHNPGTYYEYETSFISDFYLRMNWGWYQNGIGLYNGWYLYGDFTPGNLNLNSDSHILINIHP
ncbi:MAG: C10 family peptidase [Flavobacteriales bacterium]|nr:C10 family peptidase [Flavobacteriales bacterium]